MKSKIKFFMITAIFLGIVVTAADAQTVDSLSTPSTLNIAPETVIMADTVSPTPTVSSYSSTETETIRVYSGSHSGNNISRTYEVPLPAESATRRNRPY